jgi:hypothetical protein
VAEWQKSVSLVAPHEKLRDADVAVRRECVLVGTRGICIPSGFVNKTHFKMRLTEDPWV